MGCVAIPPRKAGISREGGTEMEVIVVTRHASLVAIPPRKAGISSVIIIGRDFAFIIKVVIPPRKAGISSQLTSGSF